MKRSQPGSQNLYSMKLWASCSTGGLGASLGLSNLPSDIEAIISNYKLDMELLEATPAVYRNGPVAPYHATWLHDFGAGLLLDMVMFNCFDYHRDKYREAQLIWELRCHVWGVPVTQLVPVTTAQRIQA